MKFGAVLPTCEIGNDPIVIRDFAQAAEELGYSHLLIYDHVLGAEHADREPALGGPYTNTDPFHEPFVLYGYLAGVTSRIELATGVIILPQRQTVLVAKQATELDLLSEGRFSTGRRNGMELGRVRRSGRPPSKTGGTASKPRWDCYVSCGPNLW